METAGSSHCEVTTVTINQGQYWDVTYLLCHVASSLQPTHYASCSFANPDSVVDPEAEPTPTDLWGHTLL